jgi:rod shape-determining protein MreC
MARKQFKVSRRMLFTWFMLGGLILLFTPHSLTNKFQFGFARIFRWPLGFGRSVSLAAHRQQPLTDKLAEQQYQNYIANLEEELWQERQKVEHLSELRNRRAFEGAKLVVADVITATINNSKGELIINRGQDDGVAKGQYVLGLNNVIGTVSEAGSRTAKVRLVTDPASKVEIKLAESDVKRVMQGAGNDSAKIRLLSKEHKVKIGDGVFAHKTPGLLDGAMIIGKVTDCKTDKEHPLLWDITVKPSCNTQALENVAVVIMNPQ